MIRDNVHEPEEGLAGPKEMRMQSGELLTGLTGLTGRARRAKITAGTYHRARRGPSSTAQEPSGET